MSDNLWGRFSRGTRLFIEKTRPFFRGRIGSPTKGGRYVETDLRRELSLWANPVRGHYGDGSCERMQLLDLCQEGIFASHGDARRFSTSHRRKRSCDISIRDDDRATSLLQALWRRTIPSASGKSGKLPGEHSLS